MTRRRLAGIAGLMIFTFAIGCQATAPVPDRIFYNGKIVTLDSESTIAEAIAISGGIVQAVGTNGAILDLAGPDSDRVDLEGRTVFPGFSDNHYHGIGGGPGIDLSRVRSIPALLEAIAERARETAAGELLVTNSDWHEGQLAEQRLPYRDELDGAAPEHPLVVVRGGHEFILNSAALAKWKIDESLDSPPGGNLGRYPDGRLNGELVDRAKDWVTLPDPPAPDFEEQVDALAREHLRLNAAGLTSIRYAGASSELYQALKELKRLGRLSLRVSYLVRLPRSMAMEDLDNSLLPWEKEAEQGDDWLRVSGIKLGVDGGFEGGWMREPYSEPFGEGGTYHGLQTFGTQAYIDLVVALSQRGWRVATHAVGDAAIDLVLKAYEAANEAAPITGRRWSIEHGFIPREDQFPRMKALGLSVAAQDHLYLAAPSLVKYWGEERAHWTTPLRAYLDAGIPVSLGTDSPVVPYPPLWVLYHFITRDTISAGVVGKEQAVRREEALGAMSLGGAHLTFEENRKGSIETGKLADLVVLSEDLLTCAPQAIASASVILTVVGGEIVHSKSGS